MNKREVDRLLPLAYDVIEKGKFKDKKTGVIDAAYRGQISAYGAAIANGSLLAATAFFSKEGDQSKVNRGLLMKAINELLEKLNAAKEQIVKNETAESSDAELVAVIAAAVAAYEGTTDTSGFVVRSIRKIKRQ